MIINDLSQKNISNISRKKISKIQNKKNKSFSNISNTSQNNSQQSLDKIISISPMLFLNEIDNVSEDNIELQLIGNEVIKSLKNLQVALLDGELTNANLYELKNLFKDKKHDFQNPEIKQCIEHIMLRVEIEIAKIETLKTL